MKRFLLALLLFSLPALAQQSGPFVLTATTSPCATINTANNYATVGIRVSGTFSATLQPGVSIQGQPSTNTSVVPVGSTTSQNTITAAGAYTASVAGASQFQICATGFVSGSVTIWLNVSTGISAKAVVAAGGGVQTVTGTPNQVASSGGQNPVLSLPAAVVAPGSVQATKAFTSGINAMGNVTGAAVAIDLSLGNVVTMTLTGNVTSSSFTNATAAAGQEITFIITQDGTGGRTLVWPTAITPALLGPAPTLTASSVSTFKGVVDGSGNVNFATNGPIPVFRLKITGLIASDTTHAVAFTPPVVGNYRINATILCTATGAGGSTMTINSAGQNQNVLGTVSNAIGNTSTVRAAGSFSVIHANDTTSSSGMGFISTLSGTIGTATYTAEVVIEWLGE